MNNLTDEELKNEIERVNSILNNSDSETVRNQRNELMRERMRRIVLKNTYEMKRPEIKEEIVNENLAGFDTNICYEKTKEDINGNNISSHNDVIVIIDRINDWLNPRYYCFSYDELFETFKNSTRLYEWNTNRPIYDLPIFNISIPTEHFVVKIIIDTLTYNYIIKDKYSTILLTTKRHIPIGSIFGVSRLHGSEEDVYSGIPINREDMFDKNKLLPSSMNLNSNKIYSNRDPQEIRTDPLYNVNIREEEIREEILEAFGEEFGGEIEEEFGGEIDSTTVLDISDRNLLALPQLSDDLVRLDCSHNELTEIQFLPLSLTELDCSNNFIERIQFLPDGLQELCCDNNQITFLPNIPHSLQSVSCSNNQLTSIPNLHETKLVNLTCNNNKIQSIGLLPSSLIHLNCRKNQLTYISELYNLQNLILFDCSDNNIEIIQGRLPQKLTDFYCNDNKLEKLPIFIDNKMTSFNCSGNKIKNLALHPSVEIKMLNCNDNLIENIPRIPVNLVDFHCSFNRLTELPSLPSTLTSFECSYNQLVNLPELPENLYHLDCGHNKLKNLPELHFDLKHLDCSANELKNLPILPSNLDYFDCSENYIRRLSNLPSSLLYLNCASNNIVFISSLPQNIEIVNLSFNNLKDLPQLPLTLTTLICKGNPELIITQETYDRFKEAFDENIKIR